MPEGTRRQDGGRRQRPVRRGGDLLRAASSSAATRSRRRRRSCTSSTATSGSTAGRCCSARTRSRASARASGASFAGKKVLTATSGPGMSLKTEMIGLATISELPLVVRQRAARRAVHRHPDQERAVGPLPGGVLGARRRAAPGAGADQRGRHVPGHGGGVQHRRALPDAGRSSCRTRRSAQRKEAIDRPVTEGLVDRGPPASRRDAELEHYVRYKITESGVSPISHPGMKGGNYLASGIEHTESGAPTATGSVHAKMNEKRLRKLNAAQGAARTCSCRRGRPTPRSA